MVQITSAVAVAAALFASGNAQSFGSDIPAFLPSGSFSGSPPSGTPSFGKPPYGPRPSLTGDLPFGTPPSGSPPSSLPPSGGLIQRQEPSFTGLPSFSDAAPSSFPHLPTGASGDFKPTGAAGGFGGFASFFSGFGGHKPSGSGFPSGIAFPTGSQGLGSDFPAMSSGTDIPSGFPSGLPSFSLAQRQEPSFTGSFGSLPSGEFERPSGSFTPPSGGFALPSGSGHDHGHGPHSGAGAFSGFAHPSGPRPTEMPSGFVTSVIGGF